MKKLVNIMFFLFIGLGLTAQNKLTNAVHSLKNNELEKAKELIDAAAIDPMFKDMAATWYFRGNVYKELFKKHESNDKQSNYRSKSVDYFKKSIEMDTSSQYEDNSRQNLRYLAETIYNHAAVSFTTTSYPIAMSNYSKYKEILSYAYPSTDFKEKDILFHLALANTFSKIAEEDSASADMYTKKAKENYEKVLTLDSNNVSANYNIGIIYYNQGVEIVNNMDYSLDLEQLNQIQDQVIELFKKSLPYMKKAYDLDPKKKETLIGLQGIYYSLNDIPKSEAFKKELELLKQNQDPNEEPEDVEMQE
ncbi:MAG: tetratricopeptide repeat protein [Vicingaceae bacterium]